MNTEKLCKRRRAAVFLACIVMVYLLAACAGAPETEKVEYEGTLEEKINAFYDDHRDAAAGMQMAVFDSSGVLFKGYYGYSDIENKIPVDENTVIDWGSTTKTLVWVSVMQLWEQGKIDLEADIRDYLPEGFLSNLSYDKSLRMIDLMNHRAGFQEYYTDIIIILDYEPLSLEDALLQDPPPQIFEPDTVTAYSNWGVALAGYIVERVSGMSFCDYVHQNIFAPLGMNDSAIAPDLSDNPDVRQRRDKLVCYSGTKPMGTAFYLIQLYPAGMCVSTLDDFIAYGKCFVEDDCPLFENGDTLDALMTATSYFGNTDVPKNAHGFWALPYGENTYGHGGNTAGCSSNLLFDPVKRIGAVVMTNQAGEETFNEKMMELIFGESAWDYDAPEKLPNSLLHPARTVLKGHYKAMGETYISVDTFEDMLWTYNDRDGIAKIEMPYGDYYFVTVPQMLPSLIAVYGWIAALVFSLASLVVALIKRLVRAVRKRPKPDIPSGKWCVFAAIIQLFIGAAVILAVAMGYVLYYKAAEYLWLFTAVDILGGLLAVCAVYGAAITARDRKSISAKGMVYRIAMLLFAAVTLFAIVYEQIW